VVAGESRPALGEEMLVTTLTLPPLQTAPTAGSAADFAAYVAGHRRSLVAVAYTLTRDHHSAEDLVQCVLASMLVAWPRIRDPRAADAYVRRAMANQNISWWRQRWRNAEQSSDEVPEPRVAEAVSPATTPGAGEPPDERARLWGLVQALPPKQRAAVVLRFYEDMSEAEVARTMGCSVGTVKSNTSRGLAALRASIGNVLLDEGQ
jgi:RNA polymerase sigma-70 factor (sigma-E family)